MELTHTHPQERHCDIQDVLTDPPPGAFSRGLSKARATKTALIRQPLSRTRASSTFQAMTTHIPIFINGGLCNKCASTLSFPDRLASPVAIFVRSELSPAPSTLSSENFVQLLRQIRHTCGPDLIIRVSEDRKIQVKTLFRQLGSGSITFHGDPKDIRHHRVGA